MSSTKVLLTYVNSTYAIGYKQLLCFTKLHHKVFSRRCRPINRKVPIFRILAGFANKCVTPRVLYNMPSSRLSSYNYMAIPSLAGPDAMHSSYTAMKLPQKRRMSPLIHLDPCIALIYTCQVHNHLHAQVIYFRPKTQKLL